MGLLIIPYICYTLLFIILKIKVKIKSKLKEKTESISKKSDSKITCNWIKKTNKQTKKLHQKTQDTGKIAPWNNDSSKSSFIRTSEILYFLYLCFQHTGNSFKQEKQAYQDCLYLFYYWETRNQVNLRFTCLRSIFNNKNIY